MYIFNAIPYTLFYLFTLLGFLIYRDSILKKYFEILVCFSFYVTSSIFIGCRGYIAADWLFYYPFFEQAPSIFDGWTKIIAFLKDSQYEKGYAVLNVLIKTITGNYLYFQFILFTIDFVILTSFFREYVKKYFLLAFAVFFIFQGYVFEIIILRNAKAIILFLISLKYLYGKKILPYIALNILGVFFHVSSIVYIIILPFFFIKRNKKVEVILFILGNIVYLLQLPLAKNLIITVNSYLPLGRISKIITTYLSSEYFSSAYGITIGYLERVFTFIVLFSFSDRIIIEDNRMTLFWKAFLTYSYIYLYLSDFFIVIERLPNLFVFSYWILLPKLYIQLSKKRKYFFIILLSIYGILKMMMLLNQKWAYYDNFLFNAADALIRKQLYTY